VLLVALWVTVNGCRAVVDWATGSDAEAAASRDADRLAAAAPPGDDEPCPSDDELYGGVDEAVPPALDAALGELAANPEIVGRPVSISVWVDGWGEVVAHEPDLALKPASNQKLIVAIGALELLDPDNRLMTEVRATAAPEDGVVEGDLVVVGGGDPTLWDVGEHSLYELAEVVHDAGVTRVTGTLSVDESRYDDVRVAPGWTPQQIPGDAAPISAFTVKANRLDDTPAYLADPAYGNAQIFLQYLADVGVTVDGGVAADTSTDAEEADEDLVSMPSPTIAQLVDNMLRNSDNTTAELLLKEIDRATGGDGSTAGGLDAARAVIEGWCVDLEGHDDDGSGLSYANERSAREWREILQIAQRQEWWPMLDAGLPVAGDVDGTLAGRLTGPATAGNLRAKTGTIDVGRALTGVFTTAGGRSATFSVIINDDTGDPTAAVGPTDVLLETIASSTS